MDNQSMPNDDQTQDKEKIIVVMVPQAVYDVISGFGELYDLSPTKVVQSLIADWIYANMPDEYKARLRPDLDL